MNTYQNQKYGILNYVIGLRLLPCVYEKTLKTSVVDKKFDQKEAEELKKIYNLYLDKRKEIMRNTQFRIEDVFCDVISKDNLSE